MLLWNYMFYLIFIERSTSTGIYAQSIQKGEHFTIALAIYCTCNAFNAFNAFIGSREIDHYRLMVGCE